MGKFAKSLNYPFKRKPVMTANCNISTIILIREDTLSKSATFLSVFTTSQQNHPRKWSCESHKHAPFSVFKSLNDWIQDLGSFLLSHLSKYQVITVAMQLSCITCQSNPIKHCDFNVCYVDEACESVAPLFNRCIVRARQNAECLEQQNTKVPAFNL